MFLFVFRQETAPDFVAHIVELPEDDRIAPRLGGLSDELHPCFARRSASLANIAIPAGADDIFPGGRTTPAAREDMIQTQPLRWITFTTILATVLVPQKNVPAVELNGVLGNPVVREEADDAGNLHFKVHRAYPIVGFFLFVEHRFQFADLLPAWEIVVHVGTLLDIDDFSLTFVKQTKSPPRRDNMDRLKVAIERQDRDLHRTGVLLSKASSSRCCVFRAGRERLLNHPGPRPLTQMRDASERVKEF